MRRIDARVFERFATFLFGTHRELEEIRVLHTLTDIPSLPFGPHWHIDLPETIDKFDAQLSGRERRHSRYYERKLRDEIGDVCFETMKREFIPQNVVDLYLSWKRKSHGFAYSANSYLDDFCVSNAYLLKARGEIVAIGFDSETNDENVFFENFSYDMAYSRYSVGMTLYHKIIETWIGKKKKRAYLLGGNCEYKQRYNGVCTMTHSGCVYRHPALVDFVGRLSKCLRVVPFRCLRRFLARTCGHVFLPKYYRKLLLQKL